MFAILDTNHYVELIDGTAGGESYEPRHRLRRGFVHQHRHHAGNHRNSRFSVSAMRILCREMHRREAIQQYAESIAREFHPEKIILFGSHAYGQPTEDSDVDLMVVMPFRGNALEQAFRIRDRLEHPGFPLDLLVRSPREIGKRQAMGDFFIREILDRGTLLYAGSHS